MMTVMYLIFIFFFSGKGKPKAIFPRHVIKGIGVFTETQTEYSQVYIFQTTGFCEEFQCLNYLSDKIKISLFLFFPLI